MSDRYWRKWERAWEADPTDQDALRRAISARQRAGVSVPGWMIERQIFSARSFNSALPFHVFAQLPDDSVQRVGRTPHSGRDLEIPDHTVWWVQPVSRLPIGVHAEFDQLAGICHELTSRDVPGLTAKRTQITNTVLAQLAGCSHLRWLELGVCDQVTEEGLGHLAGLPLSQLRLNGCAQIEDSGIRALRDLPSLTRLELHEATRITDAGVAQLPRLASLTELRMTDSYVTDAGLWDIARAREIHTLRLENCNVLDGSGLGHLAELPRLRNLGLSRSRHIGDEGLRALKRIQRLRTLELRNCSISDAGLVHVGELRHLESLTLGASLRITSGGLRSLGRLERLADLDLAWCQKVGDLGLMHLKSLENLTSLNLKGSKATAVGLQYLRRLPKLRHLDLGHCDGVTDEALGHLLANTQIAKLNLTWCAGITDEGLGHLAQLASLRELDISFCSQITDAGLERLLACPNRLTALRLEGSDGVSEEACERFREARPGCQVISSAK